jgi:3D-(3,5/4)-trihydroxycyclohexane-1,2-dione acylhydrolase (decyclizing)
MSTFPTTVSQGLIEGLIKQGVKKFFVVLGHGTTDLGEALRITSMSEQISVIPCRNEIEATHGATALRWVTGEAVAVVTSIGPGALQAVSASLVAASNGIGVWFLLGDETTHDEGHNMQQIVSNGQSAFFKMFSQMSETYLLHTPEAIYSAIRKGSAVTNHPTRQQPFFLLIPINVQPKVIPNFNPDKFGKKGNVLIGPANTLHIKSAALSLSSGKKVIIKVGRGAKGGGELLHELSNLVDGVFVMSPSSLGIVPSSLACNMGVGGSKGSISGNYAMENAEILLVVGSRSVCQSDCSRTGYPKVKTVINLNADIYLAQHYDNSIPLIGDVSQTLELLIHEIVVLAQERNNDNNWRNDCSAKKKEWLDHVRLTISKSPMSDKTWAQPVLTQPAVVSTVLDWVQKNDFKAFFDAGDVQANGFQIAEVDSEGWFYSESGASYMGFASSALLAGGVADKKFYGVAVTGDGSFMMNPQVLIDAVHSKTRGCIVLLDNQRMGAISSLQIDQYEADFATSDEVHVDYVAFANAVSGVKGIYGGTSIDELSEALNQAKLFEGLSVVHVPVYFGTDVGGGLGSFGQWNVGPWVMQVEKLIAQGGI